MVMLEKPKTVRWWGKLLFNAGGLATIVGIWGVLALRAIAMPAKLGVTAAHVVWPTRTPPFQLGGFLKVQLASS